MSTKSGHTLSPTCSILKDNNQRLKDRNGKVVHEKNNRSADLNDKSRSNSKNKSKCLNFVNNSKERLPLKFSFVNNYKSNVSQQSLNRSYNSFFSPKRVEAMQNQSRNMPTTKNCIIKEKFNITLGNSFLSRSKNGMGQGLDRKAESRKLDSNTVLNDIKKNFNLHIKQSQFYINSLGANTKKLIGKSRQVSSSMNMNGASASISLPFKKLSGEMLNFKKKEKVMNETEIIFSIMATKKSLDFETFSFSILEEQKIKTQMLELEQRIASLEKVNYILKTCVNTLKVRRVFKFYI